MPEQALYLSWRPLAFDEMVGQEHITRTLRNALRSDRVRHAYLFSGPRGTGKTTTARLLAKAVNCLHPDPDRRPCNECAACIAVNEGRFLDLIEIDAATHTGVDDVRDLREKVAFSPGEGRFKVYIIDEVHRFSGSAFDALLKTLEEPPEHAIFVLATTEIDKVPATIKSRCLQFEFRRFSVTEVADRLERIVEAEALHAERPALERIARQGGGSMRDSISLLDQIVTDPTELISLELVERVLGTASDAAVRALVEAVIAQDAASGLRVIQSAMDHGSDPRQFAQQTVEHLRAVLLAQMAGPELIEASEADRSLYAGQAAAIGRSSLLRALRAFNDAIAGTRGGWQPQLALELALVGSVRGAEEVVTVYAAPPAAHTPATAEPLPPALADHPGPHGITAAAINDRWDEVLRIMSRFSKTSPDVMKYFRAQRVEGNVVYLVAENETYFKRINPYPEKQSVIVRALREVFRVPFTLHLSLGGAAASPAEQPLDLNDPLLSAGAEYGAEIRRVDQ
ncbi:MAG: DNA polymerase III subunit gamma/tau [Anaerolineae bacterium]|nr:DNA polymerase III subunit gamma/tau [Anaerolineae bacterium]